MYKNIKWLVIGIFVVIVKSEDSCKLKDTVGTVSYLNKLFTKYGNNGNSSTYISNKQFQNLLKSIVVGSVFVECEAGDTDCEKNLATNHGVGANKISNRDSLYDERKRRAVPDKDHEKEIEEHKKHWKEHLNKCLKEDDLFKIHAINDTSQISRDDFLRLCPSLIQQIDSKVCVHTHVKEIEHSHGSHGEPTKSQVWGYGVLSITVISLLSLSVISMIPCLKKSFYHKVMAYLVALAVGTLSGDALLHLIPHAFAAGVNSATNAKVSAEDQIKQHYSQVWRALFVLLGIYIFFLVEQLMKVKAICSGGHGHSHGNKERGHSQLSTKDSPVITGKNTPPRVVISPSNNSMTAFMSDDSTDKDGLTVKMSDLAEENNGNGPLDVCHSDLHVDHEEEGHYHADERHHSHHHGGEKEITKDTKIASVAWMVVVGDGFHNFSDGLAVGAAFSASMSSGLSTAIAVFCHELPHELGDFAILINSGMTFKQAIVYNLVSAILAYLGLAVGIFIGGSEMGRHFILSITAGLFLYVSLADMLPELTHQEVPHQNMCSTFIFQHLGILSGIGIMLVISLFEHIM